MTASYSILTEEYVYVPVTAETDPTDYTVEFAYVAEGTRPAEGDWAAGGWFGTARTTPTGLVAEARHLLVASTLTVGTWDVWVRLDGAPESAVKKSGPISVF